MWDWGLLCIWVVSWSTFEAANKSYIHYWSLCNGSREFNRLGLGSSWPTRLKIQLIKFSWGYFKCKKLSKRKASVKSLSMTQNPLQCKLIMQPKWNQWNWYNKQVCCTGCIFRKSQVQPSTTITAITNRHDQTDFQIEIWNQLLFSDALDLFRHGSGRKRKLKKVKKHMHLAPLENITAEDYNIWLTFLYHYTFAPVLYLKIRC